MANPLNRIAATNPATLKVIDHVDSFPADQLGAALQRAQKAQRARVGTEGARRGYLMTISEVMEFETEGAGMDRGPTRAHRSPSPVDLEMCEAPGVCERMVRDVVERDKDDVLHIKKQPDSPEMQRRGEIAVRRFPKQALRLRGATEE